MWLSSRKRWLTSKSEAEEMGTLTLPPYFNLQEDCKELRLSFKGVALNSFTSYSCSYHSLCKEFTHIQFGVYSVDKSCLYGTYLGESIRWWVWWGGWTAGLGCNEKRVIEILGRRTQSQRLEIAQAYQTVYGESLHKRLKAAFNGKLEVSLN